MVVGHIERSLDSQPPLPSKIALVSCLGLGRHERHEIVAVANLFTNLLVPGIPAAEFAFVVPNLKSIGRERIPNPSRSLTILRGVTQKNGGARVIGVSRDARHDGTESHSLAYRTCFSPSPWQAVLVHGGVPTTAIKSLLIMWPPLV